MIYDDDVELLANAITATNLSPWEASWEIARAVLAILDHHGRLASRIVEGLRGDGPCKACHTEDNIRWFTDSTFWNTVIGGPRATDDPGGILCIPCFVKHTDYANLHPNVWRLTPEFHWETKDERRARRATAPSTPEAALDDALGELGPLKQPTEEP